MKKRFAIILTAAALSMTGCSLLGQDTYYIDQGMEQINSGNYEEALTSFSSAEQEGKHLVESYRGSGMAYMALGEYDKAVEAFDRAVDLTKEKQKDVRKDILMYKATALYQSGDYEGAAKVCDTIQTFGDSADAYYLQGLWHPAREDPIQDHRSCNRKDLASDPENLPFFLIFDRRSCHRIGKSSDRHQRSCSAELCKFRINIQTGKYHTDKNQDHGTPARCNVFFQSEHIPII